VLRNLLRVLRAVNAKSVINWLLALMKRFTSSLGLKGEGDRSSLVVSKLCPELPVRRA
jgi:hypothetical protein